MQRINRLLIGKNWESWVRVGIVALTLMIAVYIGFKPYSRVPALLILATGGLVAFFTFNKYLEWGMILLVPIAFIVEYKIRTGTNVNLNLTFMWITLLLAIWLLRMLVVEKQFRLLPSPVNLPAVLFIIAMLISWVTSFLPWVPLAIDRPSIPAQLGAFLIYAYSIAIFLFMFNVFKKIESLKIFTWVYIGFGLALLLSMVIIWGYSLAQILFINDIIGNSVFWTMLTALMFGQALFNRDLKPLLRWGLAIATIILLVFELVRRAEWVSGWLPPLIVIFILIWLRDWRIGVIITLIGGLILFPIYTSYYNNQVNTVTQSWSTFTRFSTWPIMTNLLKANPVTGLGPGNYRFYTSVYFYLGYYIEFNSHNNYIDIMLQYGLIGFGLFLWLVGATFFQGWRIRKMVKDGFSRGYVNAVLAGFVGVLISGFLVDWFLPFLYNIEMKGFQASVFFWIFLGGMLSLYFIKPQVSSTTTGEA
jgi:O-antigen ligase